MYQFERANDPVPWSVALLSVPLAVATWVLVVRSVTTTESAVELLPVAEKSTE